MTDQFKLTQQFTQQFLFNTILRTLSVFYHAETLTNTGSVSLDKLLGHVAKGMEGLYAFH